MKPGFIIPLTIGILTLSLHEVNELYAHGPVRRNGHSARPPASAATGAASAAQFDAQHLLAGRNLDLVTSQNLLAGQNLLTGQNLRLSAQQLPLIANLENTAIATQLATLNAQGRGALAGQIALQEPRLSPQQAALQADYESSTIAAQIAAQNAGLNTGQSALITNLKDTAIATQLVVSSAADRATLAAQVAAQNPRLSPHQVALQAGNESSAIAAQIAAENPRTSAQQAALLANYENSSIARQQEATNALQQQTTNAASALQEAVTDQAIAFQQAVTNNAYVAQGGLFTPDTAGIRNWTPGFGRSTFYGNGTYQPAQPEEIPVDDAGVGYAGEAQTVPGAALEGTAQVIKAIGQYNLATSAAAVKATQGQSDALRDDVKAVQTFWEVRDIGRRERAKERRPLPTPTEVASIARKGVQRGLNASQRDPVTGALLWPGPLQQAKYDSQRAAADKYAAKWASGGLDHNEQRQMRQNIVDMLDVLKSQITQIPAQEYLASRSFLQSLLYATTGGVI